MTTLRKKTTANGVTPIEAVRLSEPDKLTEKKVASSLDILWVSREIFFRNNGGFKNSTQTTNRDPDIKGDRSQSRSARQRFGENILNGNGKKDDRNSKQALS